jgi:erythromycin esterase-like protein/predicted phosphoribosyltransferase
VRFQDRRDAGRALARHLLGYANRSDVVVLGLPRGGVPVAAEVAAALAAPLDVWLVRKLGVPGQPEFAMGAIAEGGIEVLDTRLIERLGIPRHAVEQVAVRQRLELDRHDQLFRSGRAALEVTDRVVIVVDDGLATGATMEAAVMALRQRKPAQIIVAAPVGARDTVRRLSRIADRVVCPLTPEPFDAVGLWYERFDQTDDDEVRTLLARSGRIAPPAGGTLDPVDVIRRRALPLSGDISEYDHLADRLSEARVVLLGEATHGTHEFYRARALLTGKLLERGFNAVAVEADWPDAYRVNQYVRGRGQDGDAAMALSDFRRFPSWMWRNADVLEFVGWLRAFNDGRPPADRAGFYGLDLYSLHASMTAVLAYLETVDPVAAARARERYACFDRFGREPQEYAYATGSGLTPSCEREVLGQLRDLRTRAAEYAGRDGRLDPDAFFAAEQNARLVLNAEEYYRTMLGGQVSSWNLRDRHMVATLGALMAHLTTADRQSRVVVWAHNSHLGDARATEMHERGEINVGQLVREQFGSAAMLVGFTTFDGTVTAASTWDGPAERKAVRPALAGSIERLLHDAGMARCALPIRTDPDLADALRAPRLERAIGVLYLPKTERQSHYFHASLARQFDFVLHVDRTRAVEPMERRALWEHGELAETYPTGL